MRQPIKLSKWLPDTVGGLVVAFIFWAIMALCSRKPLESFYIIAGTIALVASVFLTFGMCVLLTKMMIKISDTVRMWLQERGW